MNALTKPRLVPGDRVLYVNDHNAGRFCDLKKGETYTVWRIHEHELMVCEDSRMGLHSSHRFVPAPLPEGPLLDFGGALAVLRKRKTVARAGWNGKGMWIALEVPRFGTAMTLPFLAMRTVQGDMVPWLASQTDLLAEDWVAC